MTKRCLQTRGEWGGERGTELPGVGGGQAGRSGSQLDGPQRGEDAPVPYVFSDYLNTILTKYGVFSLFLLFPLSPSLPSLPLLSLSLSLSLSSRELSYQDPEKGSDTLEMSHKPPHAGVCLAGVCHILGAEQLC